MVLIVKYLEVVIKLLFFYYYYFVFSVRIANNELIFVPVYL